MQARKPRRIRPCQDAVSPLPVPLPMLLRGITLRMGAPGDPQMPPSGTGSSCLAVLPLPLQVLTALMFAAVFSWSVP